MDEWWLTKSGGIWNLSDCDGVGKGIEVEKLKRGWITPQNYKRLRNCICERDYGSAGSVKTRNHWKTYINTLLDHKVTHSSHVTCTYHSSPQQKMGVFLSGEVGLELWTQGHCTQLREGVWLLEEIL